MEKLFKKLMDSATGCFLMRSELSRKMQLHSFLSHSMRIKFKFLSRSAAELNDM